MYENLHCLDHVSLGIGLLNQFTGEVVLETKPVDR